MATLAEELLPEVKTHLGITHNEYDILIKDEIDVAVDVIYHDYLMSDVPATLTKDSMSKNVILAVRHLVTQFRTQTDGMIAVSNKYQVKDTRLIRRILGKERRYMAKVEDV